MEFENKTTPSNEKLASKDITRHLLVILAIAAVVIAIAAIGLYAKTSLKLKSINGQLQADQAKLDLYQKDPAIQSQQETDDLINKVGQLIALPQNETPTIATVTDPSKLKDQPFFVNAQSGDKVLIYTTAKKAIIYRPSSNQIIEVAPLNLGDQSQTGASSASSTK